MLYDHLQLLSEPLRVRLLSILDGEELSVTELMTILQAPQSTISRHLKSLRVSGWVDVRKDGNQSLFRTVVQQDQVASGLWQVVQEDHVQSPTWEGDHARRAMVLNAREVDSSSFFGRDHHRWESVRAELFGEPLPAALGALLPHDSVVADLGCGSGLVSSLIAPFVQTVHGIDREASMLKAARIRCQDTDNVELHLAGLTDLPLKSNSVDIALCILVLHHLPDPISVLREAHRVVKQGGRLIWLDMQPHERSSYRQSMGHKHLGFSTQTVTEYLDASGFRSHRWRPVQPSPEVTGPHLFVVDASP